MNISDIRKFGKRERVFLGLIIAIIGILFIGMASVVDIWQADSIIEKISFHLIFFTIGAFCILCGVWLAFRNKTTGKAFKFMFRHFIQVFAVLGALLVIGISVFLVYAVGVSL